MTSMFCITFIKGNSIRYLTRLCKASKNFNSVTQVAFMKTLVNKAHTPKPAPFPYWKKQCNDINMIFDLTSLRYDENSKLIIVEGPPAVGKNKLCEQIAKEFGLLYMPPPVFDEIYVNYDGFDLRSLNAQLKEEWHIIDLIHFLRDPGHQRTAQIQYNIFMMRIDQYMNALLHILATGQGVVLNRSIFTEAAYMHAMYNSGYLSKRAVNEFEMMRTNSFHLLLRPHLIVYLDATPETVLERIKKRGNEDEINSKVFTKKFLSDLSIATKEKCLYWLSPHSEILMYDWNKESNYMDIINDIEILNLEEEVKKKKFEDWVFKDTSEIIDLLQMYHTKNYMYCCLGEMTISEIALEMYISNDAVEAINNLLSKVDSEKYAHNCNPKRNKLPWIIKDKNFKMSMCRRTPRDFINCDLFKLPC
ncbi:NADH dehydrogenase [ubiquinone] 1 alpha subcomplex subunit 10, mitochondrial [Bombus pascuorum]|uniref:NADH dehydrogenase [ubiquinone] 1 alpha subcomplex subunit 10, mitochondrial n=1 Tax=Bombus pascuorum TaxID=65598 RepID=UPI00213606B8|nr:NADH dehydrogenase [ubiquinone] 1 alpha subcomplex subunit 10, mitochondrial [Bombus pascuorum]XP_060829598.1 NADH dehydrogenase [ubiquinone] 1 alpha subcomplex subunit 10, mitochondrial [Bombus pascuorum]